MSEKTNDEIDAPSGPITKPSSCTKLSSIEDTPSGAGDVPQPVHFGWNRSPQVALRISMAADESKQQSLPPLPSQPKRVIKKDATNIFKRSASEISKENPGMAEKTNRTEDNRTKDSTFPPKTFADPGTINDDHEKNRTEYILSSIKELMLHLILVAVVTTIAVSCMPPSRFNFQNVFTYFLTGTQFQTPSGPKTFRDVHMMDQIWNYLERILIPFIYLSDNDRIEATYRANLNEDLLLVNENILVVLPRVRQVRVRNNSCEVPDGFLYLFDTCYFFFNQESEDKTPFGLKNGTLWSYQSASKTKGSVIKGGISTYSGGGYYMDFSPHLAETKRRYVEMWNNTWIDHGTRAIIIDVVSYSQTDNLFGIATLLFETPPSGGVLTSADVRIQQLLRYESKWDSIILGLEGTFSFLLVYYTMENIIKMASQKSKYFWNISFIFDWIILFLGYATVSVGIVRFIKVNKTLSKLRKVMQGKQYMSFHEISNIHLTYEALIGCLALVIWLKTIKYMNMVQPGALFFGTLKKVWKEILALIGMMMVLIFGFAMCAHVAFGTYVEEFNSIGGSMFCLTVLFSGGIYIYKDCEEVRPIMAPVFFISYIFIVILLFLNWFTATIVYGLNRTAKDLDGDDEQIFVQDILRNFFKKSALFCKCKRIYQKMDNQDKVKQERSGYSEIVLLLKRNGFSVLERAIFLNRHDVKDDDAEISTKLDNMIADLNGMNNQYVEIRDHEQAMEQMDKLKKKLEVLDNLLYDMNVKADVLIDSMRPPE